jgi:CO/xanthine dehydrogenase Mo-binding subunit
MDENEDTCLPASRRTLLETGTAAALLAGVPEIARAVPLPDGNAPSQPVKVDLQVNGRSHAPNLDPRRPPPSLGPGSLQADGEIEPGATLKKFSQQSCGAQFAEVGVGADTGEVRLRRMLGVFTARRVLNGKTARSQAIGGMIFGVGAALTEAMVLDRRFGNCVNHDPADYHVAVRAGVPDVDAVFLPELHGAANPLKSKGIGELGIRGAGASLANAIHNACGARIRDYPITLDKVLSALPVQT